MSSQERGYRTLVKFLSAANATLRNAFLPRCYASYAYARTSGSDPYDMHFLRGARINISRERDSDDLALDEERSNGGVLTYHAGWKMRGKN